MLLEVVSSHWAIVASSSAAVIAFFFGVVLSPDWCQIWPRLSVTVCQEVLVLYGSARPRSAILDSVKWSSSHVVLDQYQGA